MTKKKAQKNDVLTILQATPDQYVSGEYLSGILGITRSGIWKRIALLKKEGYIIQAATRKGYRLVSDNNAYGEIAILNALATRTFGRKLKYFEQIDSTNTVLKQLAAEGSPEGTTVVADCQTTGRGRLGKSWMSAPDRGIWMSVLLRPKLHPSEVQSLTLAASVAICQALAPLGISNMGIKWPNDILIEGKKVCGILTELSAEAERVAWVILGIGINVNHLQHDFPDDLALTATSLRLQLQNNELLDRSKLAAEVLKSMEDIYNSYIGRGSSWMVDEWKRWNLTLGKTVRLKNKSEELTALAVDILPDGKLIVKKDDGTTLEVLSGEISLREV